MVSTASRVPCQIAVLEPGLLAELVVPAVDVHADLGEVERDVLGQAQLVGRVGQRRVVDHLGVAVALGLHQRGAQPELGVLPGAEMGLQDLDPGLVEGLRRARTCGRWR